MPIAEPAPADPAELATVLRLVRELAPGVVNLGHGRAPGSVARARAFERAWRERGGHLGIVVSWPATAASWLRPATRLARGADTWVVADDPAGWTGIGPRLAGTGAWWPAPDGRLRRAVRPAPAPARRPRADRRPARRDPGRARLADRRRVAPHRDPGHRPGLTG
ncbi:MAG TPA: hypothetical protein VGH99_15980 [Pseudonocardia sp.]